MPKIWVGQTTLNGKKGGWPKINKRKQTNFLRPASVTKVILIHEKFLQFDWLRAVVCQLNLKYLHVKITNLLQVVV